MSYTNQSTSERLYFTEEALVIVQEDPVVAEVLAGFGFTPDRVAVGFSLYEETFAAFVEQQAKFGEQLLATDAVNTLFARVRAQFRDDRRVVRGLLAKKRASFEPFGLNQRMHQKRERLINQAAYFYGEVKASEPLLADLQERYMMPAEVFDSRLQELDTLRDALQTQQVKRAEARLATQRRRALMKKLDAWMLQLIGVARSAFREDPRQLEKLGLAVRVD